MGKKSFQSLLTIVLLGGVTLGGYIFSKTEPTEATATTSTATSTQPPVNLTAQSDQSRISICSFNIQFLGNSRKRDDLALALILTDYDVVVVQELVSPPFAGTFPDGTPFKPDAESAEFFDAMAALGFEYILSEEDTGTGDKIHRNGSSTEWFVAFYKPHSVALALDLPNGFLANDRSNHDDFERVPFAFPFRSASKSSDFVLISVHLMPGSGSNGQSTPTSRAFSNRRLDR